MTDLNAGLEFGFLSSLVNISFPSGLLTLEFLAADGTSLSEEVSVNSWTSIKGIPQPPFINQLISPDGPPQAGMTFTVPGKTVSNFGGAPSSGNGIIAGPLGTQTFPAGLLVNGVGWPQPLSMFQQPDGNAVGAYFLSLRALGIPFKANLQMDVTPAVAADQLQGTLLVKLFNPTPTSFEIDCNNFPVLDSSTGRLVASASFSAFNTTGETVYNLALVVTAETVSLTQTFP